MKKLKIGLAICVLLAGAYFVKPIVAGIGDVIAYFNESGTEVFSVDQDGLCTVTSFTTDTVDINGGAIDGTTVGASSASTGAFTTLTASGVTSITDTTDASDTSTASLKTAGGLAVQKKAYFGGDVSIISGSITGITDLAVADGGTGLSALTAHKLIVGNGTSAATLIDVGTNGQILLGQTGADPSWQTMNTDATIDETGTVTIANGAVTAAKMAAAGKTFVATCNLSDVSTEDTIYMMLPKCTVTKVWSVLDGTIATADATITITKDATPMGNGTITIGYDGSAQGDLDSCTPTSGNTFDGSTECLRIWTDGASTNAVSVRFSVICTMTD